MTSRSTYIRITTLSALSAFCFVAGGCDRAQAELDDRRQVLDARAVIAAYASHVPDTYPAQERWMAALKKLEGLIDPVAMQQVMTREVVPALIAYADIVAAVADVPPELSAAHGAMAAAHRAFATACRAFADGLDRRSYVVRRGELTKAIAAFNDAQRTYAGAAAKVYAEVGVDVMPAPPPVLAGSTSGAPPEPDEP